ncbi:hypothetical protein ABFV80_002273 [Vandammella animalimorsus]|uniref:hypothetical protein n=1 Tax=Vandammella animalimorsus TaxID=2029117 RepID=UPI00325B035F
MNFEYANTAIAAASVLVAFLGACVAYWAAKRQAPKPDIRIDALALGYYGAISSGDNAFIATVTNHGGAVAEIARTEVHAVVDGSSVEASVGPIDVAGTLAAGANKELWLNVTLPEPLGMDVHEGRKRLRVIVTLHPKKGRAIRASFDFSRDPGYGFVPSATP